MSRPLALRRDRETVLTRRSIPVAAQREKERQEHMKQLEKMIERSDAQDTEQFRQLNHLLMHMAVVSIVERARPSRRGTKKS